MISERWEQVKELFEAALEQGPTERATFLAQASAGDEGLREEVESLLEAHDADADFMNTPVGKLVIDESVLTVGQPFGPYQEITPLGEGGMGQVYLAVDTRLGRKVALKLLPSTSTGDADRVHRFEQEARAASALNHPNIVTIHEIGQVDSLHFIATEFVDGKTLREHISKTQMTVGEVLEVAAQVASALQAAHEAGIVHRDVKPENLMLRRDGFVKVLDFGLAKLAPDLAVLSPHTLKGSSVKTNPGVVMGTAAYMSPEQARGAEVDARTDVWSLGVVLYEMVAGRVPFAGETSSHVIVAILESGPPTLSHYLEVPAELERIIFKALRKNRADRYQTAIDLGNDLKSLKEKLNVEALLNRGPEPNASVTEFVARSDRRGVTHTIRKSVESTVDFPRSRTENVKYFVGAIKRHKTLATAVLLILVVGAIGLIYFGLNRSNADLSASSKGSIPGSPLIATTSSGLTPNRGTTNDEAYRLYLQGKNLTNKRNLADDQRAIEHFEQAVRLDPNFARAYAGMANAYHSLGIRLPPRRVAENEKAKEAVRKALELDNSLGEAYAVRGIIDFAYDWDFEAAEKDLSTAVALEPNNDTAHWGYALLSAYRGHFDKAMTEIETALAIAPGTVMYERDRGRVLYYSRRYDEAIVQLKRVIELKANFPSAWSWLLRAHEMKGDYAGAYHWFIEWEKTKQDGHVDEYQRAYETAGWLGVRQKILEFSKLNEHRPESSSYELAQQCALLGHKEWAFEYLNKAIEKRQWEVAMLNVDPQLDPLLKDPRFDALVRSLRLK